MQIAKRDARDLAVIGFEDDRHLIGIAVLQVAIEAVVRGIELAVSKPAIERRLRLVEDLREWLMPGEVLARQAAPKAVAITIRLGA